VDTKLDTGGNQAEKSGDSGGKKWRIEWRKMEKKWGNSGESNTN